MSPTFASSRAATPSRSVSDHGGAHIWTRKQPVTASGTITVDGVSRPLRAAGLVDDSAGYHARHTAWEWCAGVGTIADGRAVTWNFVAGIHDAPRRQRAHRMGRRSGATRSDPSRFRLISTGSRSRTAATCASAAEAVRSRRDNFLVMASDYTQPFGTANRTLPGGVDSRRGLRGDGAPYRTLVSRQCDRLFGRIARLEL